MVMILATLIDAATHRAKNFCEAYLIAHDPRPYAEDALERLIENFRVAHDPEIKKEIEARLDKAMLSESERAFYQKRFFDEDQQ